MVSVIICTHNRAASLRPVLDDLARITPPALHDVEILVVDNNSTDQTAEMMHGMDRCGPFLLRYLFEREQGLSHARNRGIREARGSWIVFTDDDVRIDPDWLAALIQELESSSTAAAGGRVVPIWPSKLPSWVATEGPFLQQGVFLHYDVGTCSRLLGRDDPEPFGCNMAFRSDLFGRYGLFHTGLGRSGRNLMAGEDTEMFCRLRAAGIPICYVADAVVRHPVEAQRLSLGYLVRWKFWSGFGSGRADRTRAERTILGVPIYVFRLLTAQGWGCIHYGGRGNWVATAYQLGGMCANAGFVCGVWFGRKSSSGPL